MIENEIKDCLIQAIEKKEMTDFLLGRYPYNLENQPYEINLLNTNTATVLLKGIYSIIETTNDDVIEPFQVNLLNLLTLEDELATYACGKYLLDQCRFEKRGRSPFVLEKEELIAKLSSKIYTDKEKLRNYKNDELQVQVDLLEEIKRVGAILARDFSIDIL